ncbi:hypothetical protein M885DRAFT_614201 [Pelagophyceae sp. CCMP2097]|nr:hypothetical protein M885DRAFT_614201 [Pelagophyceae sp. CCMP2097]
MMTMPEYSPTTPEYSLGGKGVARGPLKARNSDFVPGPGAYDHDEALGKQADSRRRSAAQPQFPATDRRQATKVFQGLPRPEMVLSPGPCNYEIGSPIGEPAIRAFSSFAFGQKFGAAGTAPRGIRFAGNPGPGEYDARLKPNALAASFGISERTSFAGAVKSGLAVAPAALSSLGSSSVRPVSAAFSFAGGPPTVPRERPPAAARPRTTVARRGATVMGRDPQKYAWLSVFPGGPGGAKPQARVGPAAPRSRDFTRPAAFSFCKDDRFTENTYTPHRPTCKSATPGPVYDIPEVLGVAAPAFSFASKDGAASPRQKAKTDDTPGPGTYNIRLEHRLEALLEAEQVVNDLGGLVSPMLRRNSSLRRSPARRSGSPRSGSPRRGASPRFDDTEAVALATVVSSASEFGWKFGDVPSQPTSPAYSFGVTTRAERAKCFGAGLLNKDHAGLQSPGPGTAKQGLKNTHAATNASDEPMPPQFSFGGRGVERNASPRQYTDAGPAQFGDSHGGAFGADQIAASFDKAPRSAIDRHFVPNDKPPHIPSVVPEFSKTPGPIYLEASSAGVTSVGKQHQSAKQNAPNFGFSKATREKQAKLYTPQSGARPRREMNPF